MTLLASACTGEEKPPATQLPARGTALEALWLPGAIGWEKIEVGSHYWFAISPVRNSSNQEIELISGDFGTVPDSLRVTGHAAYNIKETNGLKLNFHETKNRHIKAKDYSKNPIRIKPKTDSDFYYMVRVTVVKKQPSILKDCSITYRQGNRLYKQKIECTFMLGTLG
ncbi:hypothetical protein ACWCQL_30895 [Streptomyces sp. NPDC002073]